MRVNTSSVRHSAVADADGSLFIAGFEYTQDPAGAGTGAVTLAVYRH